MHKELVKEEEAQRALNQLLSAVVGRKFALQTNIYKDNPAKRIEECHYLVINEFTEAVGDPKWTRRVQMKMDSIQSLTTLAKLVGEVIYD
tara:strand:- start:258 stop:527 length:270 start_codon:yes stop_codon:yes gene_type:complete